MRRREPEKCEWEPGTLPFPISGPVSSTSSLLRAQLHPEHGERGAEHCQGLSDASGLTCAVLSLLLLWSIAQRN